MTSYPKANRTVQWFGDKFSSTSFKPNCGVLHTTEGYDWPGYDGGAKAPTYTAKPNFATRRLQWRAHFEDEESSRALQNLAGGVETNTASAIQVELIGTCDPKYATSWGTKKAGVDYIFWPNAPQWALIALADFIAYMNKKHGIRIYASIPVTWTAYPESYGYGGQRFTFDQWRKFYGWCGHQHVPENQHGDPGNLPWAQIARYADTIVNGKPSTTVPTPAPVTKPSTEGTIVALGPKDADAIWGADIIDAPVKDDKNPKWTPASYLIWTLRTLQSVAADVKAIRKILETKDTPQ